MATSTNSIGRPIRPGGSSGKKTGGGSSVTITMSDFQTYEMQARQVECKIWIESVINEEIDSDLHLALKDGVVLCKLANIMFPGIIPRYNKQSSITFKLLENINSFLKVPKQMGISEQQIFIATDLWENKNFQMVIGTLSKMATIAVSKGFPIKWPVVDDPNKSPKFEKGTTDKVIDWDHSFINISAGSNSPSTKSPLGSVNRLPKTSFGTPTSSPSTTTTTSSPSSSPYRNSINFSQPQPKITPTQPPKPTTTPQVQNPIVTPPIISTQPIIQPTPQIQTTPQQIQNPIVTPPIISTQPIIQPKQLTKEEELNKIIQGYNELTIKGDNGGNEPIHYAARDGNLEALKLIVTNENINIKNNLGRTALHFGVLGSDVEVVRHLLSIEQCDCNQQDTDGNTPVHLAVLKGDHSMVEAMVSKRKHMVNTNAVNKDGSTPMMMVSLCGDERMVDLLLEAGADVNSSNKKGNTALHYATLKGHKKVVDKLLEAGSDVNAVNQDGATSLHVAAEENFPNIIESLAKSGAVVDQKSLDGWTPLYSAASKGNLETATSLLSKFGALVDSHNLEGWTPLHSACSEGHLEMAQLLVGQYGSNVNSQNFQGTTPLFHACSSGHLELVKYLMSVGADPELSISGGWKPIHIACYNENDQITRYLVEKNVNLDCTNSEIKGYAPIHILISTEEPRLEIIDLLLGKSINVNIKNVNGSTPLHLAVFWNHFKVLELLLKYNASLDERNNKGRTPLSLACHYGNEVIAKYLAEKTNKDVKKLKIKNNRQKILDMLIPESPPRIE